MKQKISFIFFILLISFKIEAASWEIIQDKFISPNEASAKIFQLAQALETKQDNRSLFPFIYSTTIDSAQQLLTKNKFKNKIWVEKLIVNYANIYRKTILRELQGSRSLLPKAWQEEFIYIEKNKQILGSHYSEWNPLQDVINGINVHIARDLVEALFITPTDFENESIQSDYLLITEALNKVMPQIWTIYLKYLDLNPAFEKMEKQQALQWISHLRKTAWQNAFNAKELNNCTKNNFLNYLDQQTAKDSKFFGAALTVLPQKAPIKNFAFLICP